MSYSISYTPKSEEELLRMASQRVASGYDEQAALYEQQAKKKEGAYREALAKLDPAYARLGAQVESQYEQKRQDVSDAALARGFGRSSYVTDVIAKTHDEQLMALDELGRRRQEEAQGIEGKIEALYDELFENQARLSAAKQNKILGTIDQLRLEQEAREMDVWKVNADMELRLMQLGLSREQMAAQRETAAAQLSYNSQKAAQEESYRQAQLQLARDEFTYRQQMDALNREAAERAAAQKAALEQAKLQAKGTGKAGGTAKKTAGTGIAVSGIRL